VAGSTHAGEEEACLAAQQLLLASARERQQAPPLLALAPRRPERFETVARLLAARHVSFARSAQPQHLPGVDVLLIDEMGVLPAWYAAGDVAFVGGSLVPVGGHNLLEPAQLGRPVLGGPHQFNAPEVAAALLGAGAMREVDGAAGLAAAVGNWLEQPEHARAVGAKGAALMLANRGAARRAHALVTPLLRRDQAP
jgi:3-deoxy-D-manno-octulosonic-acid transferase